MFGKLFSKTKSSTAQDDPYAWLHTDGYTAEDKEILERHMDLMREEDSGAADDFLAEHGWTEDYALSVLNHFHPYTGVQIDAAREAFAFFGAGKPADVIHASEVLARHNLTLTDVAECNKHYWAEVRAGLRDHT